jgi:transposase
MVTLSPSSESTTHLGHYGLIAGVFDELEISDLIDDLLPKKSGHNVPHSTLIKAMCINGLGFTERRLYIFPDFFDNLPTERLLGEGVLPEYLNDDAFGRTLDKIYEYGPTELFNRIILQSMKRVSINPRICHIDTTNFSVYGNYENNNDGKTINITYGYPKDKRADLLRFSVSMVTDQKGIPLFLRALDGNTSDKKALIKTIRELTQNLDLDDKVYHVADSAFYTEDNVKEIGTSAFFISRVPAVINEAKELIFADLMMETCSDERYSFYASKSRYGGVDQLWVVFCSEEMKKREEKTFDEKILKYFEAAEKSLKKLSNHEFACEADARIAAEQWLNENESYEFTRLEIKTKSRRLNNKKGRPMKDEEVQTSYLIDAEIEPNQEKIQEKRTKLGRFILATNDLELNPDQLLKHYKEQGTVERGFRFLKDKSFMVSDVFLKKETRIEALTMIMVLCLLLYSIAEWKLRTRLEDVKEAIRNQVKRKTQTPTMKWVFFLFRRITELEIEIDGRKFRKILNLDEETIKVLKLMGEKYEKYYV